MSQFQLLSPLLSEFRVLGRDPVSLVYVHPLARRSKDTISSTANKVMHKAGGNSSKATRFGNPRTGNRRGWPQTNQWSCHWQNIWRRGEQLRADKCMAPTCGRRKIWWAKDKGWLRNWRREKGKGISKMDKTPEFHGAKRTRMMNDGKPLGLALEVTGNFWERRVSEGDTVTQVWREGRESIKEETFSD